MKICPAGDSIYKTCVCHAWNIQLSDIHNGAMAG